MLHLSHAVRFQFEKKSVRQIILSLTLFNLCVEKTMRVLAAQSKEQPDCIIGGWAMWNLRYADDTTLIGNRRKNVHSTLLGLYNINPCFGLKVIAAKIYVITYVMPTPLTSILRN